MILQALIEYYERLAENGDVEREGWCSANVSYGINLAKDGQIRNFFFLKKDETRGKKTVMAPIILKVPEMGTRSSGVSANFLCDNSKYFLGIDKDGVNLRTLECFQAAKERHLSILQNVPGEMAEAVRHFFEQWDPERARECSALVEDWENVTDGGNLIFCMGLDYAQDDFLIAEAWENVLSKAEGKKEGVCLVTGKRSEIARIHRQIKGVPGAQSSGAALVSFNAPAFESYGKEQSYNAPVGKYAEFAYTTALNYLLKKREYTFQLADSMILFWAESAGKEYQMGFSWSAKPTPDNQEELKGIFKNLKKKWPIVVNQIELNPDQRFFILGLAPNAARLSVRFFYQDSFGNILKNFADHYERMEMVRPAWDGKEYLGVWDMLMETVNKNSKDKSPLPNMAAMVMQAILSGSPYPAGLYTDTLIRIRAEQGKITRGRAAIIKAFLIRNYRWEKGEEFMGLNMECRETAYVLGRLFAVLEAIQMDTNPGIKSTIRDRYFNSACTAPASVFPILIRLKNSHMRKLEREKGSAKIYYEKLLTEMMEKLEKFPKRLTLEEQGKFDIGYYHQMQKRYEKREEQ